MIPIIVIFLIASNNVNAFQHNKLFFSQKFVKDCHQISSQHNKKINKQIAVTTISPHSKSNLNAVVSLPRIDFRVKNSSISVSRIQAFFATILSAIGAIFGISKAKMNTAIKLNSDSMESGWTKRGYGGSFSRTIEIWFFAVSFLFKFVSLSN
jgi:hypothetical protein